MDKRLNSTTSTRQFNVGDFILLQKDASGKSGKPCCRWIGPFLVMDRKENDPSLPMLDIKEFTNMTLKEAAASDC
jgi:hypothetical protein